MPIINKTSMRPHFRVAVLALLLTALLSTGALALQTDSNVKYTLKSVTEDPSAIDVKLNFNMAAGQSVVLTLAPTPTLQPTLTMMTQSSPDLPIAALPPMPAGGASSAPDSGASMVPAWQVTSPVGGQVEISYRASSPVTVVEPSAEAPGDEASLIWISDTGLKAFRAGDALLVPLRPNTTEPISTEFEVAVEAPSGQSALAPWSSLGKNAYSIGSLKALLSNFIAWGQMDKSTLLASGPTITAGFASEYADAGDSEIKGYGNALLKIRDEYVRIMGQRPQQSTATVLVTGSERNLAKGLSCGSGRDSFVLLDGETKLEGSAAAAAARGWFGMWNGVSLVAASGGEAGWFEDGMPWFMCYRTAGVLGMMNANDAYEDFCGVYADYLTQPSSLTTSLTAAQSSGESGLLVTKGATVAASMSVQLEKGSPGTARDIEWLLAEMADDFDHFKGKDYTLVDIGELLEDGTGRSWDRFISTEVRGTTPVPASGFSTTDQFGTGAVLGGPTDETETAGSGKSWVYLVIAIVIIFAIPIIFSGYIRRAVKLDMRMPKLLPDFDEDEAEAEPSSTGESADEKPAEATGEPVSEGPSGRPEAAGETTASGSAETETEPGAPPAEGHPD